MGLGKKFKRWMGVLFLGTAITTGTVTQRDYVASKIASIPLVSRRIDMTVQNKILEIAGEEIENKVRQLTLGRGSEKTQIYIKDKLSLVLVKEFERNAFFYDFEKEYLIGKDLVVNVNWISPEGKAFRITTIKINDLTNFKDFNIIPNDSGVNTLTEYIVSVILREIRSDVVNPKNRKHIIKHLMIIVGFVVASILLALLAKHVVLEIKKKIKI